MKTSRDLSALANQVLEENTSLPRNYADLRVIVRQVSLTWGVGYVPKHEVNDATRELLRHLEKLHAS